MFDRLRKLAVKWGGGVMKDDHDHAIWCVQDSRDRHAAEASRQCMLKLEEERKLRSCEIEIRANSLLNDIDTVKAISESRRTGNRSVMVKVEKHIHGHGVTGYCSVRIKEPRKKLK